MGDLFNTLLVFPIINLLVVFYQAFLSVQVPYALGFAIILLTVVIRLIMYPLMAAQLKASKKMQDLAPHITSLKEKHKGDNKKLQEAQMALYKEHGVNPAAGCLPILIQFPLLIALYNVLSHLVSLPGAELVKYVNTIVYFPSLKLTAPWDPNFFGIPLGAHPSQLVSAMPFILLIPLITAALQFIQSKMMISATPKEAIVPLKKGSEKSAEPKKDDSSDFMKAFQTQSLYIFPLMLGYLSYSFPVGLSLYWNTFTLFGILQQYQISGLGALAHWLPNQTPKAKTANKK